MPDSDITAALKAGNDKLLSSLSDGYAKLGITQSTPISGGVTANGSAVSQDLQNAFNQALGFGMKPGGGNTSNSSDSKDGSTNWLDQIFNPGGVFNKIVPSSQATAGLSFPYARVVSIGLGVLLIGGGILLFAGEDIASTISRVPELAAL